MGKVVAQNNDQRIAQKQRHMRSKKLHIIHADHLSRCGPDPRPLSYPLCPLCAATA
jgi:hypothetical protein